MKKQSKSRKMARVSAETSFSGLNLVQSARAFSPFEQALHGTGTKTTEIKRTAPRKPSAPKLLKIASPHVLSADEAIAIHKASATNSQPSAPKRATEDSSGSQKAQEVVFRRRSRGLVGRIIAGAGKSGAFLLPGIFIFNAMLYAGPAHAAVTRCEKNQPVKGCVTSFPDLAKEQKRLDQFDRSINLKTSLTGVFKDVNGKDLAMDYLFRRHSLKIKFTSSKVDVVYNGEPADDIKICFEACPEESRVTWFSEKFGEFRKIKGGIDVGGHQFKIDKR